MKPTRSILDASFRYMPAGETSVAETWRRYGWRPTTDEERDTRRRPAARLVLDEVAAVRPFKWPMQKPLANPLVANVGTADIASMQVWRKLDPDLQTGREPAWS
jgi:hypothetical protein